MATRVDLSTWPRAETYHWFRSYARPHYSLTVRLDATALMAAKARGLSVYRATLFAIGAGVAAVPELRTRFDEDGVVQHDSVSLSMTVPAVGGGFVYAYVPFDSDWERFDADAASRIHRASHGTLNAVEKEHEDVVFLSCVPWVDFTSSTNAMTGPDDCIPRITWGKIVPTQTGFDMAMGIEVHHALVDGEHIGAYVAAVQEALDRLP